MGGLDTQGTALKVEPEGFSGTDLDLSFLCRFEGTLTPKQMRKDPMLTLPADRKHIITW